MARPRELYNTPAPQAMSMMGQGIADAYANAGRIEGQGMQAMGQGIAQGITSAASSIAGAYGDYKKMQSQIKTSEGFYNTLKESGYLPPELAKGIDTTVNSEVYKNMGTAEKAQFWNQATNFAGNAIGQYHKMQQIEAESAGAMSRLMAGPFAAEAARLAGTPSAPMIVPNETGAGVVSPAPVAPVPVPAAPMQPAGQATQTPNSWLNYRPRKRPVIE